MKKQVVAYVIYGNDADDMYESSFRPGTCPICGNTIMKIPNLSYSLPKRRTCDLYHTYDGFGIVSEKFKRFCEARGYPNVVFIQLSGSHRFYYFSVRNVYPFDWARGKLRNNRELDCCGSFDWRGGGKDGLYRSPWAVLPSDDFIMWSGIWFGNRGRKFPDIVIGVDTARAMEEYGLRGIDYREVFA